MHSLLKQARPWLVPGGLLLLFASGGRDFLTLSNLHGLLTNMTFVLLLALAQTLVVIAGGFDLSTGSVLSLASVVMCLVVGVTAPTCSLPVVVLVAGGAGLLTGGLVGMTNGILVTRLSAPSLLITLATGSIASGLALVLAHESTLAVPAVIGTLGNIPLVCWLADGHLTWFGLPDHLSLLERRTALSLFPLPLLISLLVVGIGQWMLAHTQWGRWSYAIGGNREAASRAGVPVTRHLILLFMGAGVLSALAGVLFVFRYAGGDPHAGSSLLMAPLAAMALGGMSLQGGSGSFLATWRGTLIISLIQNGLIFWQVDPFWQDIATGGIMLLAIGGASRSLHAFRWRTLLLRRKPYVSDPIQPAARCRKGLETL